MIEIHWGVLVLSIFGSFMFGVGLATRQSRKQFEELDRRLDQALMDLRLLEGGRMEINRVDVRSIVE